MHQRIRNAGTSPLQSEALQPNLKFSSLHFANVIITSDAEHPWWDVARWPGQRWEGTCVHVGHLEVSLHGTEVPVGNAFKKVGSLNITVPPSPSSRFVRQRSKMEFAIYCPSKAHMVSVDLSNARGRRLRTKVLRTRYLWGQGCSQSRWDIAPRKPAAKLVWLCVGNKQFLKIF